MTAGSVTDSLLAISHDFDGPYVTRVPRLEPVSRSVDFELLGRSHRVSVGVVSVSYAAASDCLVPKVAFAVSRHTGNAVVRNKVRRRFRAVMSEFVLAPGLYLVRPRQGIVDSSFTGIRSDLRVACLRLNALQTDGQLSVPRNNTNSAASEGCPA